jgi:hypothetical protein
MEVVGKHAAPALYNAVEHRRIPMRFLWLPLAKVQEGLGGKARAITALVIAGLAALFLVLYFVPYPLRMEATGQLLPEERLYIFSPKPGFVDDIPLLPDDKKVDPGQDLVKMFDRDLHKELVQANEEIKGFRKQLDHIENQLGKPGLADQEKFDLNNKKIELEAQLEAKIGMREQLLRDFNARPDEPGFFWLKAPRFPPTHRAPGQDPRWTVLTPDFRETLRRRQVEPKDPVLRLGYNEGDWEVEVKIPQKHIGQVLHAFEYLNTDELVVDLVVRSDPTHTYKGRLNRNKVAQQADPHKDDNNEAEPVVLAWVRIAPLDKDHPDPHDIQKDQQIPRDLMVTGTEVKAKIQCGKHRMGYSLFYGVWEFFYEKVVFFF